MIDVDSFWQLGTYVSRFIFWLSSLLTGVEVPTDELDDVGNAPGWVVIIILFFLIITILRVILSARTKLHALQWLEQQINQTKDEADFAVQIPTINVKAGKLRTHKGKIYNRLVDAWDEFRETLVLDNTTEPMVMRNSIRPSSFFNLEDLNYGPGFYRYLPGIFVTVGLFLTFLGLISAININIEDASEEALSGLLRAASAKFIMSLAGLFSSIVFTIFLNRYTNRIDTGIHRLCVLLESRLSFLSLEDVAVRQLKIAQGQEAAFTRIGLEMVEKIGEPLRTEIPATIARSINESMAPLLKEIGSVGVEGIENLVKQLADLLSKDVGQALSDASIQLSAAGEKLAGLMDRMDQSSGQMGQEMENAVAKLAQAVEDMTSRLARAADTTDGALNAGAERILKTMDSAIAKLTQATEDLTSHLKNAADTTDNTLNKGAENLLTIMNETLEGIRNNTAEGANALREAAADMRNSAATFKEHLDEAAKSGAKAVQDGMEEAGEETKGAIAEVGTKLVDQINQIATNLLSASDAFQGKLQSELLGPITEAVNQFEQISERIKEGSGQVAIATDNIRTSSEATGDAAKAVSAASRDLQTATIPIRDSVEEIEKAVAELSQSTRQTSDTVTRSAREVAAQAAQILGAAEKALGGEQKALEATLAKLSELLDRIASQRNQVDKMDQMLGAAFEAFNKEVDSAVGKLSGHVREMNEELAPAIDKMHEIVDRAEKFIPASER